MWDLSLATALRKHNVFAEFRISILAARKTIGQALAGVKRRCARSGKV